MSNSEKKESSLLSMVATLGIITSLAGLLLAWVNVVTAGPVAEANRQGRISAIESVAPKFDNDPLSEAVVVAVGGDSVKVYPAKEGDRLVGAAVEGFSMNGFSGRIDVMFGFDADGTVTGYEVLSHAETPGLGAKMNEWFRSPEGNRSVIGRSPARANMTVAKDAGDVDGITAATITSRAFLEALRTAYDAFHQIETAN